MIKTYEFWKFWLCVFIKVYHTFSTLSVYFMLSRKKTIFFLEFFFFIILCNFSEMWVLSNHSLVLAFMLGQLYNLIDMTDVIAEFWLNEIDFKSQFWCNANPTNQAAQVLLTLISSICHRIEIWLFFSLSSLLSQINKCWYL